MLIEGKMGCDSIYVAGDPQSDYRPPKKLVKDRSTDRHLSPPIKQYRFPRTHAGTTPRTDRISEVKRILATCWASITESGTTVDKAVLRSSHEERDQNPCSPR